MAGDDFRKRRSGDPFTMKAPLYNALIDTTRLAKQNRHDVKRAVKQEFRQSGIILVRNDSETDRERFDILGLEKPVISPTDNLEEFQRQVVMSGVVPRCPDHDGRFVVLLEPTPQGDFGKAVVSGVVQCRITVDDDWYGFAEIQDGRAGVLGSVDLGSAKILWKEEGTGTKWAIVRLSNPQDLTFCSSTSTTVPPTTTTVEPPTTTTGEDPTTSPPSTTTGEQPTTTTGEPPTSTTGSPTTGEDTTTTGEAPTTTTGDETTGEGTTTTDSGTTVEGTTTTGEGTSTTGGTTGEGTSTTGDETTAEGTTTTPGGTTTTDEPLSTTTGPEGTSTTDEPGTTTTESGTSTTPELTTTTDEAPCVVYVPTLSIDGCLLTIPRATLHIVNGRIVCEPAGDDVIDLSDCCCCGTSTTPDTSTTVIEDPVTTTPEPAITTEEIGPTTEEPPITTEEATITTESPASTTGEPAATTSGDIPVETTPEESTTTT